MENNEVRNNATNEDILAFDVNNLTAENLAAIETELKEYTATYRDGTTFKDEFYSTDQHGFADATAYNNHKNAMLTSVFKNEGFYVGKYETGIMEGPKTSSNTSVYFTGMFVYVTKSVENTFHSDPSVRACISTPPFPKNSGFLINTPSSVPFTPQSEHDVIEIVANTIAISVKILFIVLFV